MRKVTVLVQAAIFFCFIAGSVRAGNFMADTTVNGLKVELHVMAAEPFYTKKEMDEKKIAEGMLIIGGAKPVAPESKIHPNHHLVIHVYDSKTSEVIKNAKVKMNYQFLGDTGTKLAKPVEVPVVIMEAIGKGEKSTHYGNNVIMKDGNNMVTVIVNGTKIVFKVSLTSSTDSEMGNMKMQ
jgi:hypothetical protein